MTDETPDVFEELHDLLRRGEDGAALAQLRDPARDALLPPFERDANHAWYIVADILYHRGDFRGARAAAERALAAWPEDAEALWLLGNAADELGKPKAAEAAFCRALALRPDTRALRFNLGNALFDQGRLEEAAVCYRAVAARADELGRKARRNLKLAAGKSAERDRRRPLARLR